VPQYEVLEPPAIVVKLSVMKLAFQKFGDDFLLRDSSQPPNTPPKRCEKQCVRGELPKRRCLSLFVLFRRSGARQAHSLAGALAFMPEHDNLRHMPKANKRNGVVTRQERLDTVKANR
jgi:hypothetical protein